MSALDPIPNGSMWMRICRSQDPFDSLTEVLTNRHWVKKNSYLHFRHPKVQVKKKNLSQFWLSVAAISQQLLGVQLPTCFWRIKQQTTSPETSHFLCRFSLIFTSFPNLPQLKSGPSPQQAHQTTQEEWQIHAESQRSPVSPPSVVAGPSPYHPSPVPPCLCLEQGLFSHGSAWHEFLSQVRASAPL